MMINSLSRMFSFVSILALVFLSSCGHRGHRGDKDHMGHMGHMSGGGYMCAGAKKGMSCEKCGDKEKCAEKMTAMKDKMPIFTAKISPTQSNKASGQLTLSAEGHHRIKILGTLTGLPKNKDLGFHIHEYGDCSAKDGMSAGGHFNPMSQEHGDGAKGNSHAGDMGNIKSNDKGEASIDMTVEGPMLFGFHSVAGRAIVVHADKDDFKTQPTGNAGARIGCGVITVGAK